MNNKPKLLIATDNYPPLKDGITRFLKNIIPPLSTRFEITVIAPDYGQEEDGNNNIKLIKIPLSTKRYDHYQFAKIRYDVIKKEVQQTDFIFTQTSGPIGATTIITARRQKKKIYSYTHSIESELVPLAIGPNYFRQLLYPLMRWYTRFIYNKSDRLFTPSEWVAEQFSWIGVNKPKTIIKLGVNTKEFRPGTARELRRELGIKDNEIIIGQHGRIANEKDHKTLLRAFIRLRAKKKNVRLLIIGNGISHLKKILEKQPGVILIPEQEDIAPYLRAMDIFALTSLVETTCFAALEAMSSGLPIISTPVGFVRDYIKEGKNGMFINFHNSHQLAKKLEWLVEHPGIRQEMGRHARETIIKSFRWEETINKLIKELQPPTTKQKRSS